MQLPIRTRFGGGLRAFCVGGEREEERKEREKYRQWLLGQMSLFPLLPSALDEWMDGSTQCPVTPSSSHSQYYVRQCCKLVFIRTSLAADNTTEADEMPMSFRGFLNIHFNLTFLKPNCTDVYSNLFWSKTSLSAKTTLGILLLEPDFRPFRSERH